MSYNIKDAIQRIDIYCQRNLKGRPMTAVDKQVIAGHILPLITKQAPRTDITDQQTGKTVDVQTDAENN